MLSGFPALEELDLSSLVSTGGEVTIQGSLDSLVLLDLSSLITTNGLTVSNAPLLTTLEFPSLDSVAYVAIGQGMTGLISIEFQALTNVTGTFDLYDGVSSLTTFEVPLLVTIGDSLTFADATILTTVDFPVLETINGALNVQGGMSNLLSFTLPSIVEIDGPIDFGSDTALTTFTFGATLKSVGDNVSFANTALDEASVDNILVRLAALDGTGGTTTYDGHTVTITGTSAPPSTAGLTAKATLEGRGNTVNVN